MTGWNENLARPRWLLLAFAVGLLLGARPSSAATILIDFHDRTGGPGFGWNELTAADGGSTITLVWDDGTSSGIDLTLPSFFDSGNAGWNPANPRPSWAPASATNDYSFFNATNDGGSQTASFTFANLDPLSRYQIDIVASRNLDRDQDFTITHGGGVEFYDDWNSQTDGWQNGNVLTFTDLTADSFSEILMVIRREGVSASFNTMRIVSTPEPSSGLLTSTGLVWLASARRRRRARLR